MFKKIICISLLLFFALISTYAQTAGKLLEYKGEKVILSFETEKGKRVSILYHEKQNQLTYRFGLPSKIEMEYSETFQDEWKLFEYRFYVRGEATETEGIDENSIIFTNKGYQYEVFDNYYSSYQQNDIGIKITTPEKKEIIIKGKTASKTGSLLELRLLMN